ncbi:unnamed protein product, partial [marine sediment metagenome]
MRLRRKKADLLPRRISLRLKPLAESKSLLWNKFYMWRLVYTK